MRRVPEWVRARLRGPFSYQPNNITRVFEYPWAFFAAGIRKGLRVLEIGGGLSGFQFALAHSGCSVVNVDPGMGAKGKGWPCDVESMARLNGFFATDVELRNTTVDNANLEAGAYDLAFSISVIEHLRTDEIGSVMQAVYDALKPGGHFILTIDLFLNLTPFTERTANEYGSNIDVKSLVESAPFVLRQGNPAELNGYPGFDAKQVQSQLEQYMLGGYPAMVQCIVLERPR